MKRIVNKFFKHFLLFIITLTFFISCDNMNDIQREFAEREEQVYLGKVDSLKVTPGFGRAKVSWYISADPKIEQTIIYWNEREDSLVVDVNRTSSGLYRDSILVENLEEGSTLLEFRNVNSKGQSSLFTSVIATSWGGSFAEQLLARKLTSTVYNYEESIFTLKFSPVVIGDSVEYSQVVYTDKYGKEKTLRIDREINDTTLIDFPDGATFGFRNIFFLPQGLDTVFSDFQQIKAPITKFEKGKKIDFPGSPNSYYSVCKSKSIYEWTQEGDVNFYELNEQGIFELSESYPKLVSRNTYAQFFFFDDDKFIATDHAMNIYMFRIDNYELKVVKPAGQASDSFGGAMGHKRFIPAQGFFYALSGSNSFSVFFPNNNGTWGNPATTALGKLYYNIVTNFYGNYLLAIDEELEGAEDSKKGLLWSFPYSTSGNLRGVNKIGRGWDRFQEFFAIGSKLIAIEYNGDFYEFEDFNATDYYWIVE